MIDSLSEKLSFPSVTRPSNLPLFVSATTLKYYSEYAETATGVVLYQKVFLEI